ncbi:c-type cytochrome domain-containing protein [Planctomicrobium sp. SH661]|uniref:c-type cytochrome domain-containing protein n=1 Tax=Planctomicrobium sp. SH661 TaxID=3448124 RepID=UPI003F5C20C8
MQTFKLLAIILCLPSAVAAAADAIPDQKLAEQAYQILKERCSRCHGGSARQAGLDVLNRDILVQKRGDPGSEVTFISPGSVERSLLADSIEGGEDSYMPLSGSPEAETMTTEEKKTLRQWIAAGAPFPERAVREFLSEKQIYQAMSDYLSRLRSEERRETRFYSLANLSNNPSVTELDLRLYRAALSKAINSLSLEREIVLPKALPNTGDAIYAINLHQLGWDQGELWNEIIKYYPYGLKYGFVKDEELRQLAINVMELCGADLPYLRADWFIVSATQPPLYHTMLDIPDTLEGLETQLRLNLKQNFLNDRVKRSGYAKSGVSHQNRLLERHTSPGTPYFWISYDFLPRQPKADLVRFPLGPQFSGHPFPDQAFQHDGGEIIWSLPNGMQGYMLVNGTGKRIDAGPVEVVFDRAAILGTPAIVNGISCMYCHRKGMISEFRDEIRDGDAVGGNPYRKVQEIYPPHEEMQKLVRQDEQLFVRSLEQVMGPFLLVGDDAGKSVADFPEPIGKVAELYSRDLTPREVALELGLERVEDLTAVIRTNRELLRYGLGPLAQDPPGTLKREKWETRDGASLMQFVAMQLRLGMIFTQSQ